MDGFYKTTFICFKCKTTCDLLLFAYFCSFKCLKETIGNNENASLLLLFYVKEELYV